MWPHLYRIKLGAKLIRSLRPLQLGQGRSYYKGGGGVRDVHGSASKGVGLIDHDMSHQCSLGGVQKGVEGLEVFLVKLARRCQQTSGPIATDAGIRLGMGVQGFAGSGMLPD